MCLADESRNKQFLSNYFRPYENLQYNLKLHSSTKAFIAYNKCYQLAYLYNLWMAILTLPIKKANISLT